MRKRTRLLILKKKKVFLIVGILSFLCLVFAIIFLLFYNYYPIESRIGRIEEYAKNDKEDYTTVGWLRVQGTNIDYNRILDNYKTNYDSNLEYMEYKIKGIYVLVEPKEAVNKDIDGFRSLELENNKINIDVLLIGLDDNIYNKYINKVNAKYGDIIVYNTVKGSDFDNTGIHEYHSVFNRDYDLKISVIDR